MEDEIGGNGVLQISDSKWESFWENSKFTGDLSRKTETMQIKEKVENRITKSVTILDKRKNRFEETKQLGIIEGQFSSDNGDI